MYTIVHDIRVGDWRLRMIDKAEVHRSVSLLADTAVITLPAAEYNKALRVEDKLRRGDRVTIKAGYRETGLETEFEGWLLRVATDGGSLRLYCEDDLFLFRKPLKDRVLAEVTLGALLRETVGGCGLDMSVECSYSWTYGKFAIVTATGYDVLKKVQEESGADIYVSGGALHVHPPGEKVGAERRYDFSRNIEGDSLVYRRAEDKKVLVTVKALSPDGTVKETEVGRTGGDKVEVRCPTDDAASMKARGELELRRRSYDGYEGSVTGWLIPVCRPGDSVTLRDRDYEYKDGTYFCESVTTEISAEGGKRRIELGFRLN